jgi:hypothetical protein
MDWRMFSVMSGLVYLIGLILWLFCLVDTLRRQREYIWIYLLVFTGPVGMILYLVNFYVLEWAGWRRLDVALKDRHRMKQLERELVASEIPGHRLELAQIYFRQGRHVDCVRTLKPALDEDPENPRSQYTAGAALLELGRSNEAIPHLEYVVEEEPYFDFGEGPMALARAYEKAGREEEALRTFRKVLNKYRRADAVVRKADLLVRRGEVEEARGDLEQLLRESAAAPGFNRRAERQWIQRARALLAGISRNGSC